MTRTAFTKIELLVVVVIILVLLACLGVGPLVQVPFELVAGWIFFLMRVIPQVHIDASATLTAMLCLGGLIVGLHLFLRWLYNSKREAIAGDPG